jgi:DUF1680 family protein
MAGDRIELNLPMNVERVTMPPQFTGYENLVAFRRGPIIYCIEEQDSPAPFWWIYCPQDTKVTAEFRADFLGGATVLKATLPNANALYGVRQPVDVTFIPYGLWNNRGADQMRVWLPATLFTVADVVRIRTAKQPS